MPTFPPRHVYSIEVYADLVENIPKLRLIPIFHQHQSGLKKETDTRQF